MMASISLEDRTLKNGQKMKQAINTLHHSLVTYRFVRQ